jgi:hypothetical protein
MSYNRSTLWRLYQIGGPDLALRYAEIASESDRRRDRSSPATESPGRDLKILNVRFSARNRDGTETEFATGFPASTNFIWCRTDLESPWKHVAMNYRLVVRCYRPDGALLSESEDKFDTTPGIDTLARFCLLSESAGAWRVGTYRVQIEVDDQRRSAEFAITPRIDLDFWRSLGVPSLELARRKLSPR